MRGGARVLPVSIDPVAAIDYIQAVSQGVRRFGKRRPPAADAHLQKPHNAGPRREARFFNPQLGENNMVARAVRAQTGL